MIIITRETVFKGGREGGRDGISEPPPPGAGHRALHIWCLAVTSSPCRHPSAHWLECVSFTKYSVCRSPVNAWLFLASARWSALLAGAANMQTYAYGNLDMSCIVYCTSILNIVQYAMHTYCISILTLQERNGIWIWGCSVFFCWVHLTQDQTIGGNRSIYFGASRLGALLWNPISVSVIQQFASECCGMKIV